MYNWHISTQLSPVTISPRLAFFRLEFNFHDFPFLFPFFVPFLQSSKRAKKQILTFLRKWVIKRLLPPHSNTHTTYTDTIKWYCMCHPLLCTVCSTFHSSFCGLQYKQVSSLRQKPFKRRMKKKFSFFLQKLNVIRISSPQKKTHNFFPSTLKMGAIKLNSTEYEIQLSLFFLRLYRSCSVPQQGLTIA